MSPTIMMPSEVNVSQRSSPPTENGKPPFSVALLKNTVQSGNILFLSRDAVFHYEEVYR